MNMMASAVVLPYNSSRSSIPSSSLHSGGYTLKTFRADSDDLRSARDDLLDFLICGGAFEFEVGVGVGVGGEPDAIRVVAAAFL